MIRINLLPHKEAKKRKFGQQQLLLFIVLLILEGVGLYVYHGTLIEKKVQLDTANAELNEKIKSLQSEKQNRERYEKRKQELLAYKGIFDRLKADQTGPANLLQYISFILRPVSQELKDKETLLRMERQKLPEERTITQDQLDRLENEVAQLKEAIGVLERIEWQVNWDPGNIFIIDFKESAGTLELAGMARDHQDVAEFFNRIQDSGYFVSIKLDKQVLNTKATEKVSYIEFSFKCKIDYRG